LIMNQREIKKLARELMVSQWGYLFMYCNEKQSWVIWDGERWRVDGERRYIAVAREFFLEKFNGWCPRSVLRTVLASAKQDFIGVQK